MQPFDIFHALTQSVVFPVSVMMSGALEEEQE